MPIANIDQLAVALDHARRTKDDKTRNVLIDEALSFVNLFTSEEEDYGKTQVSAEPGRTGSTAASISEAEPVRCHLEVGTRQRHLEGSGGSASNQRLSF